MFESVEFIPHINAHIHKHTYTHTNIQLSFHKKGRKPLLQPIVVRAKIFFMLKIPDFVKKQYCILPSLVVNIPSTVKWAEVIWR